MLKNLSIKNFAISRQVDIAFESGLSVFTGETGAGKSLLLKSLAFLLGQKVDASVVGKNSNHAEVTGEFTWDHLGTDKNSSEFAELMELGIDGIDSEIIIRRQIQSSGRSRCWINDTPTSLSTLKKIAVHFIDLVAQHDHHLLLQPKNHQLIVDACLRDRSLVDSYQKHFQNFHKVVSLISEKIVVYHQNIQNIDYLKFRLKELAELDPSQDEYEEIRSSIQSMQEVSQQTSSYQSLKSLCDDVLGGDFAYRLKKMANLSEKLGLGLEEMIRDIESNANDIDYKIVKSADVYLFDEGELNSLQKKYGRYLDLMKLFNVKNAEDLKLKLVDIETQISDFHDFEHVLEKLWVDVKKSITSLEAASKKLQKIRQVVSKSIETQLCDQLHSLAMPHAEIKIVWEPVSQPTIDLSQWYQHCSGVHDIAVIENALKSYSSYGSHHPKIYLKSNKGQDFFPLEKIASGGELSRILLAIKSTVDLGANSCLLVFDEIDSGISGNVAFVVGKKLSHLSNSFQTICISHLPQVTAFAHHHYMVQKLEDKSGSFTQVQKLSKQDSESEVARLLSAESVDKYSIGLAKKLIQQATRA